jgi:hypothetical protein
MSTHSYARYYSPDRFLSVRSFPVSSSLPSLKSGKDVRYDGRYGARDDDDEVDGCSNEDSVTIKRSYSGRRGSTGKKTATKMNASNDRTVRMKRYALFSDGTNSTSSSSKSQEIKRAIPFPRDYDQMIQQAQSALQKAIEDDVQLGEMQFPPGGLTLAPGDLEGNVECTLTATVLRKILRNLRSKKLKEERITVLFPDPIELKLAVRGQSGMCSPDGVAPPEAYETDPLFEDWRGEMSYLDDPNLASVSGLDKLFGTSKGKGVCDRVNFDDSDLFVCAYPSGNIAELTQTRELYERVKSFKSTATTTKMKKAVCVVNGELDRTRSNYYPFFWNKKEMEPLRQFALDFEGLYFIHNFKGSNPAVLFRCYPDDWRVFRRRQDDSMECVWSSAERKSLKEIALEVLPKHL